jgi:hypothetical protein
MEKSAYELFLECCGEEVGYASFCGHCGRNIDREYSWLQDVTRNFAEKLRKNIHEDRFCQFEINERAMDRIEDTIIDLLMEIATGVTPLEPPDGFEWEPEFSPNFYPVHFSRKPPLGLCGEVANPKESETTRIPWRATCEKCKDIITELRKKKKGEVRCPPSCEPTT